MKTNFKKCFFLLAMLLLIFSFAACTVQNDENKSTSSLSSDFESESSENKTGNSKKSENEQNAQSSLSATSKDTAETTTTIQTTAAPYEPSEYKAKEKLKIDGETVLAGGNFRILSLGSSNGVMCAEVQNISGEDFEYCVLSAQTAEKKAVFLVSALASGQKAVLFEQNKQKYSKDFLSAEWIISNELKFDGGFDLHSDTLQTTVADGFIEIKNKSAKDIEGTVYVCYKNTVSDRLNGSTSYRMKLSGLKSGETRQLFSKNVKESSRVVYISYGS